MESRLSSTIGTLVPVNALAGCFVFVCSGLEFKRREKRQVRLLCRLQLSSRGERLFESYSRWSFGEFSRGASGNVGSSASARGILRRLAAGDPRRVRKYSPIRTGANCGKSEPPPLPKSPKRRAIRTPTTHCSAASPELLRVINQSRAEICSQTRQILFFFSFF